MPEKEVLEFYKKTSCYTDLGLYKSFARSLPNDLKELCLLIRHQTIHPFDLKNVEIYKDQNSFYGDMTTVDKTTLRFENDLFPTALSIFAELLRRNSKFSKNRLAKDKIHICCREEALLLVSILKVKGIPARCRSGFSYYVTDGKSAGDHWITEYYNKKEKRWIFVDPDMYFSKEIQKEYQISFNLLDIPKNKFITGAESYLGLRTGKYKKNDFYYASSPRKYGFKGALRALFYDFHSLMNDEITFFHIPKFIQNREEILTEKELQELDILATLMLNPDKNFEKLLKIWKTEEKYRILCGGLND